MIAYYNELMAAASLREVKALWNVQRHRLETKRLKFFEEQGNNLQHLLESKPLDPSTGSHEVRFIFGD